MKIRWSWASRLMGAAGLVLCCAGAPALASEIWVAAPTPTSVTTGGTIGGTTTGASTATTTVGFVVPSNMTAFTGARIVATA
ncbi:MAG TPA: hypothetical protein PKG80_10550, partial [Acidobacteriota bacterium]|nr:hypothetical protein [Acidobacteriota bacterium]